MAIRLLLPLAIVALGALARANEDPFVLDPKTVMNMYDDGPLECYVKNNVTKAVELQECRAGGHHSLHGDNMRDYLTDKNVFRPIAAYPVCMMIKVSRGQIQKMEQKCVLLPSVAVENCSRKCLERERTYFSDCCCTTSSCNGKMLTQPHTIIELPDEE